QPAAQAREKFPLLALRAGQETSRRFASRQRLDPALVASVDESAEQLNVQPRSGGGSGMPLHAQREPIAVRLDRLDDAIQRLRTDTETTRYTLQSAAMLAVDHDLAFAIQRGQQRIGQDIDGMT